MKSIHIRNVQPETLAALKRLAEFHHRSLQGELLHILEKAAVLAPPPQFAELQLNFVESGNSRPLGREDIYEDYR
ncbi:MAG: hypothetical protein KC800_18850 [Candidatus Eremiobacteraeota bacterium]|nr:hypothetical protein [Candidatus Eremiobacteraeota bacterium]